MGRWLALAAAAGILAVSAAASAQKKPAPKDPPPENVVYKKRTVINIDGPTINGAVEKPQGKVFIGRRLSRFTVKLPVREHFRYELLGSGSAL